MRLTDFKVLSFDCYGTLIDWETGLLSALQPLLIRAPRDLHLTSERALEDFATAESAQEKAAPSMLYSDLLAAVYATLAREWGVDAPDEECAAFGAGIPHWPVFPDSPPSLQYLKRHYRLVILSNVDRASFAGSNEKLQVEFDAIYTAEDIGSYKPDARNFDYLLEHLKADFAFDRTDVLHTAQSLFHDHVPARALGLATAWIDRRQDKPGWGATAPPPTDVRPDFHFNSLVALVEAHQDETRATRS